MKKNFMLVCIALILAMSLIVSCDNSSKDPDAGKFTVTLDTDGGASLIQ